MIVLEKSFTNLHEVVSIKNKCSLLLNYGRGVLTSDGTNLLPLRFYKTFQAIYPFYLINPIPKILEVFTYLREVIEQTVKERLNASADKNVLKNVYQS